MLRLFSPSVMSDSFAAPRTAACQAPLSTGSPRQEYWSGWPFPSPGDLPHPGIKSTSPALASRFLTTAPPGKRGLCLKSLQIHKASGVAPGSEGDLPGGLVVKTSPSNAESVGSIPGRGAKIPHALWLKKQNINNRSNSVTNSVKTLKKKKTGRGSGKG